MITSVAILRRTGDHIMTKVRNRSCDLRTESTDRQPSGYGQVPSQDTKSMTPPALVLFPP